MNHPTDGERVRLALGDMLRVGQLRRPPLSAADLRQRHERRLIPHVDIKGLVAIAAAAVLIVVFFTVRPLHHEARSNTSAGREFVPSGWIAHSAYGLQVAAPRSWSVQVFGQCPDSKEGTLFIGTSRFVSFCPAYDGNTTQVDMFKTDPVADDPTRVVAHTHRITVHGLSVVSIGNQAGLRWVIPSKEVTITGSGPKALSIMESLAPATRSATAAVGKVVGTESLEALQQIPVTGPVTVRSASGSTIHVLAIDGQFYFSAKPGRYLLTGHDGDAVCPAVSVTMISGEVVTAPPIRCQGF